MQGSAENARCQEKEVYTTRVFEVSLDGTRHNGEELRLSRGPDWGHWGFSLSYPPILYTRTEKPLLSPKANESRYLVISGAGRRRSDPNKN